MQSGEHYKMICFSKQLALLFIYGRPTLKQLNFTENFGKYFIAGIILYIFSVDLL